MAFGDILAGFAEAGHEHRKTLLQMDYEKKKDLGEKYFNISQDPNYDEDTRAEALKRVMTLHTLAPEKKLPKEIEGFTFTMKPRTGPSVDQNLSQAPGSPAAPLGRQYENIPPPTSPPYEKTMAPMPFDEQVRRTREMARAKRAPIADKPIHYFNSDEDAQGNSYPMAVFSHTDEDGNTSTYSGKVSDTPIRGFANRAASGAGITLGDAAKLVASGQMRPPVIDGQSTDVQTLMSALSPDHVLVPTADGTFYLASPRYRSVVAGGVNNQFPQVGAPTPANVIPAGAANPPRTNDSEKTFTDAMGNQFASGLQSTTTQQTPGAFPAPPAQPPQQPPISTPDMMGPIAPVVAAPKPPPQISSVGPPPPSPPRPIPGAVNPGMAQKQNDTMMSVRPAADILFGNPQNPKFESITSYGKIADNPESRVKLARAATLIIKKLGQSEAGSPGAAISILGSGVNVGGGGIMQALQNWSGLTAWVADQQAKLIEDAVGQLNPQESRMLNRIMASYGTIVGLRKFTGGGAYQFSTEAMERELPIPGFTGINSSRTYYNKLASLSEEIVAAQKRFLPEVVPERHFYEGMSKGLTRMGLGEATRIAFDPNGNVLVLVGNKWVSP